MASLCIGLENLVLTYINAINSGDLPCMENAVQALVQVENTVAVQKAMDHYEQKMDQKVQLRTETLQELLDLQRACEREAIEIFRKNSFKDEDQSFQKELEVIIFCSIFLVLGLVAGKILLYGKIRLILKSNSY
jgi:hypothetical protein